MDSVVSVAGEVFTAPNPALIIGNEDGFGAGDSQRSDRRGIRGCDTVEPAITLRSPSYLRASPMDKRRQGDMSTFEDALRKGLKASEDANAARHEVNEVLTRASAAVSTVLGAEVDFRFSTREESVREQSMQEQLLGIPPPRRKKDVLVASTKEGAAVLADVTLSELVYPVSLRWGDHSEYAPDRKSFESVVASLLASPSTGEHLRRVADMAKRATTRDVALPAPAPSTPDSTSDTTPRSGADPSGAAISGAPRKNKRTARARSHKT